MVAGAEEVERADTGDGIPADVLDQIFEPFVTTKPVGVGTGLGLSTAYGIITQSGGAISVTSRQGHGATFTIHLPVRHHREANPTTATAGAGERAMAPTANEGTVLIVEDDPQVRALIERVLTRAGYDIDAHESPLGALEAISRKAPSLVLTDIVMPDLDGFELAERVRSLDADIPVLFMSGYVDASRLAEISSGGQTIDFVAKPFTSVELLTRVAAALRPD